MNQKKEILIGTFSGVGVLVLMAWMGWSWFSERGSRPQVEVVSQPPSQSLITSRQQATVPRQQGPWSHGGLPARTAPPETESGGGVLESVLRALLRGPATRPTTTPSTAPAEGIVIPLTAHATILRDKPNETWTHELVGRTWESFALMKFDVSGLTKPPPRAVLKACVYGMENTKGQQTPLRLVFHRMKTDWDDSVTFNYAKSRTSTPWAGGACFAPKSEADLEQTPLATVEVPNPPPVGYNVEADITSVVRGWVAKEYPNYGILMRADFAPGYSYQANLATQEYTKEYLPKIVIMP